MNKSKFIISFLICVICIMAYFLYKDSLYIENIESVYIQNQKTIKTADILSGTENSGSDNSTEAQIYRLFHEFREKESICADEIVKIIDGIDWREYNKKYGESTSDAMNLLDWLSYSLRVRIEQDEENIVKLLKATNGLDGALTEQYCVIIGNLFRNDEEKFVKILSTHDDIDIKTICGFVAYNCSYYDMSEKDIKAYFESKELSDKEKQVVDVLIHEFTNPY